MHPPAQLLSSSGGEAAAESAVGVRDAQHRCAAEAFGRLVGPHEDPHHPSETNSTPALVLLDDPHRQRQPNHHQDGQQEVHLCSPPPLPDACAARRVLMP